VVCFDGEITFLYSGRFSPSPGRGPHIPHTGLTSGQTSRIFPGLYWKGDERNKQSAPVIYGRHIPFGVTWSVGPI